MSTIVVKTVPDGAADQDLLACRIHRAALSHPAHFELDSMDFKAAMPACSSFGYLGLPDGFCSSQGACHQFAIALGELGSGLYTDADISFMLDLGMYLHNLGTASQSEPAVSAPVLP